MTLAEYQQLQLQAEAFESNCSRCPVSLVLLTCLSGRRIYSARRSHAAKTRTKNRMADSKSEAAGATKQQNDGASTRQQESQRAKTLKKQARERSIRRRGGGAGPGGAGRGEKKRGKKTSRIEQKTSQKKCTGK